MSWLDKWKRSPRQDRRVVIDGVFYEQAPVRHPEPPVEEVPQTVLEIVTEATDGQAARVDARASAGTDVQTDGSDGGSTNTNQPIGRTSGEAVSGETKAVPIVSDVAVPPIEIGPADFFSGNKNTDTV